MNFKLIIMGTLFSLQGCSQKQNTMITQNPDITAANVVDKIAAQVKPFRVQPLYDLDINQSWCYAVILVNDIPVYTNFEDVLVGTGVNINNVILKSGTQKVTYRLYPVDEYKGEKIPTLINETEMGLKVKTYDNLAEEIQKQLIMKVLTPSTTPSGSIGPSLSGKAFYEGSFSFEAEVPYQLPGWENSQDLRKLDLAEL